MHPDIHLERLVFIVDEFRPQPQILELLQTFVGADDDPRKLLARYFSQILPEDIPITLYVANTNNNPNPADVHRTLLFRPVCEGPRAHEYSRGNRTLALSTYRRKGKLVISHLEVTPHVPLRAFEARVSTPVYWSVRSGDLYMSTGDFDALAGLPAHRLATRSRLQPWRRYLEWKEDLVKRTQVVIPYIAWRRDNDTCFAFLVQRRDLPEKSLENLELEAAVPLPPEDDDLNVEPRRGKAPRVPKPIRLGFHDRLHPVDPGDPQQVKRWGRAIGREQVEVVLRVDEDQARKLDNRELPAPGRLVSSIAGELSPLRRQADGITRLENSQGYCARLFDFLFDARNAAIPATPIELAPVEGGRALNPGQQDAVHKALVAPDLCLIQGPPGTGKTTVIADLCLRIALQGGRVLVASQTNLAVDNALSRLADRPAIRRLRLGAADKVEEEFKDFLAENVIPRWFQTIAAQCHRRIDDAADLLNADRTRDLALAELRAAVDAHARADMRRYAAAARARELAAQVAAATRTYEQALHTVEAARVREVVDGALAAWARGGPFPAMLPTSVAIAGMSAGQLADLATTAANHEPLQRLADTLASIRLDGDPREVSPELSALRRKRLELSESDRDEDLAELKQVNRRLKKLEEDGWLATGRQLRQAAGEALLSDVPGIAALIDALRPEPRLVKSLAQARQVVRTRLDTAATAQHTVASLAEPCARQAKHATQDLVLVRAVAEKHANNLAGLRDALAAEEQVRDAADAELRTATARWTSAHRILAPDDPVPDVTADAAAQAGMRVAAAHADAAGRLARADRWRSIQSEWLARLHNVTEADQDHLQDLYVRHANVVGMTCNEAGNFLHYQSPGWRPFDVVIIDEVSKATPTELLLPMLLGARVVLVGDHRQLPPMFRENRDSFAEAIDSGTLAPEDFDRYRTMVTASLFEELYAQAPDAIKATLWTQYRMHPQIMHAVNQFYEGRLEAGPDEPSLDRARQHHLDIVDHTGSRLLEPNQHLLWIDSSELGGVRRTEVQRGTSKCNPLEVDLVIAALRALGGALAGRGFVGVREHQLTGADAGRTVAGLASRLLPGAAPETLAELFAEHRIRLDGRRQGPDATGHAGTLLRVDARKEVGVLTFYFAQLKDIRVAIDRARDVDPGSFAALDLRTNTVDRFQGMEKAIVIASLVRATTGGLGAFVREYQRINVGLSRAQQLLVIIGAADTWKRARVPLPPLAGGEAEPRPVYADIFEIAKRHGGRRLARQLLR